MPLDVNAWIQDLHKKGSLSEGELSALHAVFSKPAVRQEVSDAFERQSDYSKKMDQLRADMEKEDAYAQQLAQWEADAKRELEQSKAAVQKYQQGYYELASKYGVAPEELVKTAVTQTSAGSQVAPAPNQSSGGNWMTKEEIDNYAAAMFKINAKLIGLNQEHIRLFGKPMENIDSFTEEALRAGQDVSVTFRNFYKVADREAELQEQAIQSRIQKAIDDERIKWSTSGHNPAAMPGNVPKGWQSPVIENVQLDHTDLADHAAARMRVSQVLQAYNAENAANGLPTF